MRSNLSRTVAVLCLTAGLFRGSDTYAGGRTRVVAAPPAPPVPARPAEAIAEWDEAGVGKTVPEAQQNAYEKASDGVAAWLRMHRPEVDWNPTVAELRRYNMVRPVGDPHQRELEISGVVTEVKVHVEIRPALFSELEASVRQQRIMARQGLLAHGLAGAIALLLVATGYLRLQEATNGRFGRRLLVGAVGLAGLAIAGLLAFAAS